MRSNKMVIFVILFMAAGLFSQQMTKEEQAVKQSIINASHAWMNRDFDGWQKLVYQSQSYYSLSASINSYDEVRGWQQNLSNTKEWFDQGVRETPEPPLTNFNFKIEGNMAFVTFDYNSGKHVRVLIKDDGLWKELYVGLVYTWGYDRVKNLNELQTFNGLWELDVSSLKIDPPYSFTIKKADLTVSTETNEFDLNMNFIMDAAEGDWTFYGDWQFAFTNSGSIQVMSHSGNSFFDSWAHIGTAEFSDKRLVAKVYNDNDPKAQMIERELDFTDINIIHEVYTWYEGGSMTRSMSYDWHRK
jgi:hypothetical protein